MVTNLAPLLSGWFAAITVLLANFRSRNLPVRFRPIAVMCEVASDWPFWSLAGC